MRNHDPVALVKAGDRCQLHPANDRWMMGDRFGEVVKVIPATKHIPFDRVRVRLDKSGKTFGFHAADVLPID